MALISLKFKYFGGVLLIVSILLSFSDRMEDELFDKIRINIANLGLIILAIARDKHEVKDSSTIKMACFFLSTFIYYIVNQLMIIFLGIKETIDLSRFVLDLFVIYLISYHYIKSRLEKGVQAD